jgi:hypothetical protein
MRPEKKRRVLAAFLKPTLFVLCARAIMAQTITAFDVPGASATHPVAINNGGDVVGWYCPNGVTCNWYCPYGARCFADAQTRGFVREFNGNLTVFDGVPTDINDAGTVTGLFEGHDFIRDKRGNLTLFDPPQNYWPIPYFTALGSVIDNSGQVAGYGLSGRIEDFEVFVRDREGNMNAFVVGACYVPSSINSRGDITGYSPCFPFYRAGFVRSRNGDITMIELGGPTYPVAINNGGDVAGYYFDMNEVRYRGFVRERGGTIATLDATPNASSTTIVSINEGGDMAGQFSDATGNHNFVRDWNGNITIFDVPNAANVAVQRINDRGDVLGYFSDSLGTHGFVRTAH